MKNQNAIIIDEINKKIDDYNERLQSNKEKLVKVFEKDRFIDSYDIQEEKRIQLKINELIYNREISRIEGKSISIYDRKIEEAWKNYDMSLQERITYAKSQRTERILNKEKGEIEYVVNDNLVRKLKYVREELNRNHIQFKAEHKFTLIRSVTLLSKTKLCKVLLFLILLLSIYVLIPLSINKIIVAKSPRFLIIAQDNDWIGFWASYMAGTFGAVIGGLIAYKIASFQFIQQNLKERDERLIELKIENAELFSERLNRLSTEIDTTTAFIRQLVSLEKEHSQNLTIENLENGINKIDSGIINIYDLIEDIAIKVNTKRVIAPYLVNYFSYIQGETSKFNLVMGSMLEYYSMILKCENDKSEWKSDFESVNKVLNDLNFRRDNIKYEIYAFESKIQKELFTILYPNKRFITSSREEYLNSEM